MPLSFEDIRHERRRPALRDHLVEVGDVVRVELFEDLPDTATRAWESLVNGLGGSAKRHGVTPNVREGHAAALPGSCVFSFGSLGTTMTATTGWPVSPTVRGHRCAGS